jgi:hypothetical protein
MNYYSMDYKDGNPHAYSVLEDVLRKKKACIPQSSARIRNVYTETCLDQIPKKKNRVVFGL